ncbi:MAG: zinc ribbon domain-containing protein [Desulfobacteraceae bacterium]|nr:MAG: zinc ribbon domain-containing protein [Desulfobacteraceae bacterium]
MPIYEYRCKSCGSVTEFLVGVGEDIAITCSHCGSLDMEKIMSAASFLDGGPNRRQSTCCGREERCEAPPCSTGGACRRD